MTSPVTSTTGHSPLQAPCEMGRFVVCNDEDMANSRARPLRCVSMGEGPPLVLLHGYAMQPETYVPLARLLADRARVVIPAIFALPERWSFEHALDCIEATLDDQGIGRPSLLGHSFGGGLELGLAARRP